MATMVAKNATTLAKGLPDFLDSTPHPGFALRGIACKVWWRRHPLVRMAAFAAWFLEIIM